jgi:hypothetical protein
MDAPCRRLIAMAMACLIHRIIVQLIQIRDSWIGTATALATSATQIDSVIGFNL